MKAKMGRPTNSPKTNRIQLRVDNETLKLLDNCVKEKKSTRSDVIREGIELVGKQLKK